MDTVHSSKESKKVLLTLFFTKEKLLMAFLMNRCTEGAVRLVFDRLEKRMGTFEFNSVFEYILTDRGSEFGNPDSLETGVNGIQRTSFEFLTQWDVNLIINHINSTPREILDGRTPYSVALESFGEEILKAFQLKPVEPDKVNLTPKLIRFKN